MRIQGNQSLFTQNRYNHTNTELNKTLNKLSSGYKINQAADDAAGLAISEKMRGQIRGLDQARENIADGLSLVEVADAGLATIQDSNLVRIRELTIQAINDTNTLEDRQKIQREVDQLLRGINDIANNTEFNTRKLLNVPDVLTIEEVTHTDSTQKEIEVLVHPQQQVIAGYIEITEEHLAQNPMEPIEIYADFGNISGSSWPDMNIVSPLNEEFGYKDQYLNSHGPITDLANQSSSEASYSGYSASTERFEFKNPKPGKWIIRIHHDGGSSSSTFKIKSNYHIIGLPQNLVDTTTSTAQIIKEPNLKIQVGPNEGQHLIVDLSDVRTNVLGLDKIDLTTSQSADSSLTLIDHAVDLISKERSKYGAYMNALQHASQNVSSMYENISKAESMLRDADMAKEMTKLQKDQVLLQSSQSMMTQLNQMSQGILQILQ